MAGSRQKPLGLTSDDYQDVPRPVVALAIEYPPQFVDARHKHPRAQLLYGCSGVMSVLTEEHGFVLPPQRALWLPAGTPHEVYCRDSVSVRTLYVTPDARADLPHTCRVIEITDLLRALILEAINLPIEYDIDGRGGMIIALILKELVTMPISPLYAPMPSDQRLARVCRSLFKEPAHEERLEEWANAVGMSRRTLTRLFRRETGMSFAAWRRHMRLLEALSHLAVGRPITTVAYEVGYSSPSAFTAMFRRTFGMTPSEYFATDTNETSPDTGNRTPES